MSGSTDEQQTLTLYRGWLRSGKHVWSPFVIKLEARLRFARVKYTTRVGSPRESPNGKIPYVELRGLQSQAAAPDSMQIDHSNTPVLGDSTLIIKHLMQNDILSDLNSNLSPEAKAYDVALRALLEDKLYFYSMRERWQDNYYEMREHALWALPYPMRVIVGLLIYRGMTQTWHGQGTGRYSAHEISDFRQEIWEQINSLLISARTMTDNKISDNPFYILGGKGPTEADATVFGVIMSILVCTACPESQRMVKSFPMVVEYASRIHDAYFPDYSKWV